MNNESGRNRFSEIVGGYFLANSE